jgi:DNA-binding NarL/FixJ family response regulator
MPGWDGLKATRLIKEEMPYVKIVMLTVSDDDQDLFEAIKSGAQGYLLKNLEPEELFELLRGVYRGEAPVSRLTAARILDEFARLAPQESRVPIAGEDLSLREKEVLQLVAQGATNKEIASQLFIAENTVKNHLRNILAKLHLGNRVQAAAYALRQGLMGRPSPEA